MRFYVHCACSSTFECLSVIVCERVLGSSQHACVYELVCVLTLFHVAVCDCMRQYLCLFVRVCESVLGSSQRPQRHRCWEIGGWPFMISPTPEKVSANQKNNNCKQQNNRIVAERSDYNFLHWRCAEVLKSTNRLMHHHIFGWGLTVLELIDGCVTISSPLSVGPVGWD